MSEPSIQSLHYYVYCFLFCVFDTSFPFYISYSLTELTSIRDRRVARVIALVFILFKVASNLIFEFKYTLLYTVRMYWSMGVNRNIFCYLIFPFSQRYRDMLPPSSPRTHVPKIKSNIHLLFISLWFDNKAILIVIACASRTRSFDRLTIVWEFRFLDEKKSKRMSSNNNNNILWHARIGSRDNTPMKAKLFACEINDRLARVSYAIFSSILCFVDRSFVFGWWVIVCVCVCVFLTAIYLPRVFLFV